MPSELTEQIKRQIGQQFVFGFQGQEINDDIKTLISKYYVGNIILMKRNVKDTLSVKRITRDLQKLAKDADHEQPLMIGVDQENGLAAAFSTQHAGTPFPGAMATAASGSVQFAEQIAAATAKELKFVGINWDYSPVADVNSDPLNPVVGVRSFGDDPTKVTEYVRVVARELAAGGVAPTAKHFPGHGDTHIDSHHGLPRIQRTLKDLETTELVPFRALIEDKIATIMMGHMALPLITNDENPSSISPVIVTDLLRGTLGYRGLIVTDCLEMDAIADPNKGGCGTEVGALKALQAGADIAMICHTYTRQVGAVEKTYAAFRTGSYSQKRIDDSNEKIRTLKTRFAGSWEEVLEPGGPEEIETWNIMVKPHRSLAEDIYQRSTTILRDPRKIIPVKGRNVVLYTPPRKPINPAVDNAVDGLDHGPAANFRLEDEISQYAPCQRVLYSAESGPNDVVNPGPNGVVIFVTKNAHRAPWQINHLRNVLAKLEKDACVIVLASCGPYDLLGTDIDGVAYVATYEFTPSAMRAAVKVTFGKYAATGQVPVAISG